MKKLEFPKNDELIELLDVLKIKYVIKLNRVIVIHEFEDEKEIFNLGFSLLEYCLLKKGEIKYESRIINN